MATRKSDVDDLCTHRFARSPNKPISKRVNEGFLQVAVERYSGALWHTWLDRDLSIAGRGMVRTGGASRTESKSEIMHQRLAKVERPILRIPTLAAHFGRQESFQFNKEDHLLPLAGLLTAELDRTQGSDAFQEGKEAGESNRRDPLSNLQQRHHPLLLKIVATECGVEIQDIVDLEMMVYDTQRAVLGGLNNDFIFASRLNNLAMPFCAVEGLLHSISSSSVEEDHTVRLIALFDDEEIGSETAQGAGSNFLPSIIQRIYLLQTSESPPGNLGAIHLSPTAYAQTLSRSFVISTDMAHSIHPNYSSKYEIEHRPEINRGVVIKVNARGHDCADSPGIALLEEVARRARRSYTDISTLPGIPLQLFVVRNDSSCGSTNGPMIYAALGVRTVDVGNPQLSMHSIRETAGTHDLEHAVNLFESFFNNYGELEILVKDD